MQNRKRNTNKVRYKTGRILTGLIALPMSVLFIPFNCSTQNAAGPFQTTGIKIGEVDANNAIIWTRLTRNPERIGSEAPIPEVKYKDPETGELGPRRGGRPNATPVVFFQGDSDIESIEGAVPGTEGETRVFYKKPDDDIWQNTPWRAVDPKRDFTCQFKLKGLTPNSTYEVRVESRAGSRKGQSVEGRFLTAPLPSQFEKVVFMVTTGQAYGDQDAAGGGYKIYPSMLKMNPRFFVHTGDILYYDRLAKTEALARWHWARMYSLPTNVDFHRQVTSYFIKDDHDTWRKDCWPTMQSKFMGEFTFEQGLAIFPEQVPMGDKTWRTFRWGNDLQIWLVEGRDFRSPNNMPDGPDKTIWGQKQKDWFKKTVAASDAAFRVLISPTPLIGPDRTRKNDNHSNKGFTTEGNELRQFISTQKNMVVMCGDRHWQYVSIDSKTGVREYSCGPASNEHAGGWTNDQRYPEHVYLNVIGGFLSVTVERVNGVPIMVCRHHGVDGEVLNEDRLTAE
ncbi:hypothetical protein BVY01_01855 [bacterium I07]|nr:hypothetical protein BVY01_01855 [bacterium I07]